MRLPVVLLRLTPLASMPAVAIFAFGLSGLRGWLGLPALLLRCRPRKLAVVVDCSGIVGVRWDSPFPLRSVEL